MSLQADGEEDRGARADGDEEPKGKEPSGVCGNCGMQNEEDAKYCDQCGKRMDAEPLPEDDGDDDEPKDSDPKPSSEPKDALQAPRAVSADATLASILGATSESPLAIKTAAIRYRQVVDTAAGLTGERNPGKIVGGLLAINRRITKGDKAVKDLRAERKARAAEQRLSLAKRLVACGAAGYERGRVFVDKVSDDGRRLGIELTPQFAEMRIDTFRGLVEGLEKSSGPHKRDPFVPDKDRARTAADPLAPTGDGKPSAEQLAWAKQQPAFASMRKQLGANFTDDSIAAEIVQTAQQSRGLLPQRAGAR